MRLALGWKVTVIAVVLLAVAVPVALANGGLKPSQAPPVQVGQRYFGNTEHENNLGNYVVDFWRLPPLLLADVVTVAWANTSGQTNSLCIQVNVDDFNWGELGGSSCTASDSADTNNNGTARSRMVLKQSGATAYLRFSTCCTGGAYEFTVEAIQQRLGVSLTRPAALRPETTVRGSAVLTNGRPVPDGLVFMLSAIWHGGKKQVPARSKAGKLSFALKLPAGAVGKSVVLRIRRASDAGYQSAASPAVRLAARR